MTVTMLSLSIMTSPIEFDNFRDYEYYLADQYDERYLSQEERDEIWKLVQYYSLQCACRLEKARELAEKIRYPTIKEIVITALKLIAATYAAPGMKSKLIASALVTIESACEAYWDDVSEIIYNLSQAKMFSENADMLEERLWRDE